MSTISFHKLEGGLNLNFLYGKEKLLDLMDARSKAKLDALGGIPGVERGIASDIKHGLPAVEAETNYSDRKREFGTNQLPSMKYKTIFQHWWEAIQDTTLLILCGAAVVSIVLQMIFEDRATGWYEGTAILLAVLIVSCVTAGNNYSQEKQFRSLSQTELNKRVKAIRGKEKVEINAFDIVVGDLILLEKGDMVPADGLCVEHFTFLIDESAMTGESDMIEKNEDAPFMISGCLVCDGMGKMLVTAVGEHSTWGKAIATLSQDHEDTPLQEKLGVMAGQIGKLGLGSAILTFIALTIFWAVDLYVHEKQGFKGEQLIDLLDFFIIGVTIVVVAVPEGLPLAVTISLAYSMKKMMKDNNLVRRLQACETMGGATNICSDKTGTLTTNQMTVIEGWVGGERFTSAQSARLSQDTTRPLLFDAISVNSTAYLQRQGAKLLQVGNKTECAMLGFIEAHGGNYEAIRQRAVVHKVYSFTSERKRMSTIVEYNKQTAALGSPSTAYRIYAKGASEIVLGLCSNYVNDDGSILPLDASIIEELNAHINDMASSGLRTICIAYADFPKADERWAEAPPEHELTCIALVGIKDPVRPEVPKSVRQCQRAGITVRMVTGDNLFTAKTIARECGILTEGGMAMEGSEFRNLNEQQLDLILPKLQVLARSTPIDKFTLVKRLKELGEVVAVTGDGTNDAPALNEAHIGLAMGIAGTDVAKEASDIIILDDNFSSIVSAVMWGRCVYDNIRKFLQFQLTINVVALITAFLAAVTDRGLPLKTVQLLWVNLIMDTLAALALGTETPTRDLLDRKPYGAKDSLINLIMVRNICMQAFYQLFVLLGLLYAGPQVLNLPVPDDIDVGEENDAKRAIDTIIFNTFVFCQLFNEFNARVVTQKLNVFAGVHKNPIFGGVMILTAVLQVLLVQFGGSFVETFPLTPLQWAICVGLGFGSLPIGFIGRLIPIERLADRFFPKKANERTPLLDK